MKKFYGRAAYIQSAGVRNDMEIDGFAIAVCQEMGIELSRHRSRSFEEMRQWGDDLPASISSWRFPRQVSDKRLSSRASSILMSNIGRSSTQPA